MKLRWFFLLAIGLAGAVRATTVVPPRFDELVREAELVFRGSVTAVRSDWTGEGPRRRLATWVTFAVERTLRGAAGETITLEFMGGAAGGRRFELAGWPRFEVGDRGVFFVENRGGRVCPLVRLRHGRYRIIGDAASGERVARDDFTPLHAADEVGRPLADGGTPARAAGAAGLGLAEFEAQIAARSAALPRAEGARR